MLLSKKRIVALFVFCVNAHVSFSQNADSLMHMLDLSNGRPELALDIINQALIDNPNSEELLSVRAEAHELLKYYDKAVQDYQRLTLLQPTDENLWYLLGRNQFLNGDFDDALKSLNRSTRLNSRFLPAFNTKTEVFLALGRYDAAMRVSDSTLNIGGTARSYFLQGEVNSRLGAWQRAQWAYEYAIRIDKGYIEAFIALATIAANQNKPTETLENAEAALVINPDSKEALTIRSRGFAMLNDYLNAIEDISYVLELYPNDLEARFLRAQFYSSSNRPQEAIRDFEYLLRLEPDNWQAIAGRADVYARIGNKAVAQEGYDRMLAIADNFDQSAAIRELANRQIFELHRENRAPVLTIIEPESANQEIAVEAHTTSLTLRGIIRDESPIKFLIINGQNVQFVTIGDHWEFVALLALENLDEIQIEVSDVYDNTTKLSYMLMRSAVE